MNILFLHRNFPGQYRHMVRNLLAEGGHRLAAIRSPTGVDIPNVATRVFKPAREPARETHHYVRNLEQAVLNGQAVFRECLALRKAGFVPDVICAHSGYGMGLFVKEAFPEARLVGLFEWFYRAHGADADFLPDDPMDTDKACRIELRNAAILTDLANCDRAVCPTEFQRAQFPAKFHPFMEVLHEGIDTDYFCPVPSEGLHLPELDLRGKGPIVTYATRGMEPYRGFPQFIAAAEKVQARIPDAQIVIAGTDRVAYGKALPDGKTFKQLMLETHTGLDQARLHFTGHLAYRDYRALLRASDAHVYLTVPFVLSWSLLEAMATGCLIVASDTAPVREVMADMENGLLVDFFDVEALTNRIVAALTHPQDMAPLRLAARETIKARYAQAPLLARQLAMLRELAAAGPARP